MNKINIKHDKKLDSNKQLHEQANYYDNNTFEDAMVASHDKRISINVSQAIYDEAKKLAARSGMGYQSVLKMCMSIGLRHLKEHC